MKVICMSDLQPDLLIDNYVFCTFPHKKYGDLEHLSPIGFFQENEGITLVITEKMANLHNLSFEGIFKCISLKLISTLSSVGLIKKIANLLANKDISANIYAGYYHDHIFVPLERADEAFMLLSESK